MDGLALAGMHSHLPCTGTRTGCEFCQNHGNVFAHPVSTANPQVPRVLGPLAVGTVVEIRLLPGLYVVESASTGTRTCNVKGLEAPYFCHRVLWREIVGVRDVEGEVSAGTE